MFDLEYVKDIIKKNYISLIGIAFGIISIIASGVYVHYNTPHCEKIDCSKCEVELAKSREDVQKEETIDENIKVDVKGAVKNAGVYSLENGSTVMDAITLAGGITSKGSTKNINLSKKLSDEMVIYVFTKDELKQKELANEVVCEIPKCECETVSVVECPKVNTNEGDNSKDDNQNSESNIEKKLVSINKGTLEELMTLDGVGESKAQAIIDYREKNGKFTKLEDIMNVSGIGEKAYEKIKDNITL